MGGSSEHVATDTFRSLKPQKPLALLHKRARSVESPIGSPPVQVFKHGDFSFLSGDPPFEPDINVLSTETIALRPRQLRRHHHINEYATFPIKCAAAHLIGTVNGHRFEALVFASHAECPNYELGSSRISKLWLKEQNGGPTVANFDRGWDIRPTTKIATAIVDFLAAKLADLVYRA
jgi:hypothetical protein